VDRTAELVRQLVSAQEITHCNPPERNCRLKPHSLLSDLNIQVMGSQVRKTTATAIAIVIVIIATAVPILISVQLAKTQSLAAEMNRALLYARDVLRRSELTSDQIRDGFALITQLGAAPCSDEEIALMQKIDLSSSYIQAVGRVEDQRLICSSQGLQGTGIPLGPVDYVTETASAVRTDVELSVAEGIRFTIIEREGLVAIIHQTLPIDTVTETTDVVLATFTPENHSLRSVRGIVQPAWLTARTAPGEVAFFDGEYVVAVAISARTASGAIAALPRIYLEKLGREVALVLVPIGLVAGVGLSFAILYLAKQQMSLPAVLRTALKKNEFFLAYQPIVDLQTLQWVGAEALLRWKRKDGEFVRPDLFIPVAEDCKLITRITAHVIEIITRDAPLLFQNYPDFHIGINLASADLQSEETLTLLQELMRNTGARPMNILVEATERGLLHAEVTRELVDKIRTLGIGVAIDDFGTGYSSLSHLEKFKFDYLKIDKSFVDTIGKQAATSQVVFHIIAMAKALDLQMIAEGVETEEQAQFLRDSGVQYAQGWLFAQAMPMETLMAMMPENAGGMSS
jgi:sensor c-di-GMP phosphodiesterase-like protein